MTENKLDKVFEFHKNEGYEKTPHFFLSEELLVPRTNNSDTQRINLFSNHINQLVHLKSPEFPKVFTNFENQVGEYSIAYKRADDDLEIIDVIEKHEYLRHLIVKHKSTGIYDIIHLKGAVNITEDYGYKVNVDVDKNIKSGDIIPKGEMLYRSSDYDKDGNFSYGVNLKAIFTSWKTNTYEDGIVISESAAKKLTSFKVEKTLFSLNTNEMLLNLYGDNHTYKSFPKVGDFIDNKILVASRRKNKMSVFYDFQIERMQEIDPLNDTIIYTDGGTVVDMEIYSNVTLHELERRTDIFSKEIYKSLYQQQEYYKNLAKALEKIIPVKGYDDKVAVPLKAKDNKKKYTEELAYYWKLSHERCNEHIPYIHDTKVYDNFKIEFTVLKESEATVGVKLTGRYGNKGIISKIEKDEDMPVTEDGKRVEIILNPLGVINRLNLSQIFEQVINGMSIKIIDLLKERKSLNEKEELYFEYIKRLNKNQLKFIKEEYSKLNSEEKKIYFKKVEKNGIYIHQPPFFGNTTLEEFEEIFKDHHEWIEKTKFIGIENKLVFGDLYFIRLKHDSSNKTSIRSSRNLNTKNLPAKSKLKKEKKLLISNNPLRLGNMETTQLFITKRGDLVEKLLKSYSTNERAREDLIKALMNPDKGVNVLDMDFDMRDGVSINREILEKYLNALGLSLQD